MGAVDREVPLLERRLLHDVHPLGASRELADGVRTAELVGTVVGQRPPRTRGEPGPLGVDRLRVVEHGPPDQVGDPGVLAHELRQRQRHEEAVAQLAGDRVALGSQRPHQDRHVHGSRRRVPVGVQHLHLGALPLDHLPGQQPPVGAQVAGHEVPRDRPVAHGPPTGEPGSEGHRDPSRGQRGERGGPGGVDHRVPQARHEDARPDADALGALRGERQRHPHVRALLRGVVDPGPGVAELLRQGDVVWGVEGGRECAGDVHRSVPFHRVQVVRRAPGAQTRRAMRRPSVAALRASSWKSGAAHANRVRPSAPPSAQA